MLICVHSLNSKQKLSSDEWSKLRRLEDVRLFIARFKQPQAARQQAGRQLQVVVTFARQTLAAAPGARPRLSLACPRVDELE